MKDIVTYITEGKKLSKQDVISLFKTINWDLEYDSHEEADGYVLDLYNISSKDINKKLMLIVSTEDNEFWISDGPTNYFYDSKDEPGWIYDDRYPEGFHIHMKLTPAYIKKVLTKDNYKDFLSVI